MTLREEKRREEKNKKQKENNTKESDILVKDGDISRTPGRSLKDKSQVMVEGRVS